ncbi:hypothetical protein O3G_MSEX002907 [Manduca sexta]|uniref:Peptidase C1A papain C-terminal domain-containing protein n=1 Tax=Manduca sexta TaxID=7130 RepID=A0A921YPU5_MANSE|nr:hypothetical protein O3G_MSEX002907 [Manduca sexta]KAG6443551.1 hypothetical protein O3G_MSEX002907 [Manduca sexta]
MLHVLLLLSLAGLSVSEFDHDLHAKYLQMPRDQFIQYFNSQNYTWKMADNPHIDESYHDCLKTDGIQLENFEIRRYDPKLYGQLPENFDARQKWANCDTIKDIFNQGPCGSCWAFATATVASDRMCIEKGLTVRLSEQDFDCVRPICGGGNPSESFDYWQNQGVVSSECRPYDIHSTDYCPRKCDNQSINYQNDKHFAESFYIISSEENDIKFELFNHGPIFAGFTVYDDFRKYTSGVYIHQFGERLGEHAVRIIGYGVENGVDYWLAANSWGNMWGDKGTFKIKRYQNLLLPFESMLYTGHAKN